MAYCTKCGKEVLSDADAKFCQNCGNPISNIQHSSPNNKINNPSNDEKQPKQQLSSKMKWCFGYFGIFILLVIIGSVFGNNDSTKTTNTLNASANTIASSNTNSKIVTTTNNLAKQEFDNFYQNYKKYHNGLGDTFEKLQISLDKTTKGEINTVDFYNFLKAVDNLFLVSWSDIDKMSPPKSLDDEKKKEMQQCIDYLSFSALTGKNAVEALISGMNNPNSIEARSNFKNNIQNAITAHKAAGENIERIKNELSKK